MTDSSAAELEPVEVLEEYADEARLVLEALVLEALVCEAAQGEVLHNDDTPMKILSLEPLGEETSRAPPGAQREEATVLLASRRSDPYGGIPGCWIRNSDNENM